MVGHRDVIAKIDDYLSGRIPAQELGRWAQLQSRDLVDQKLHFRIDLDVLRGALAWLITLLGEEKHIALTREEIMDIRRQLTGEKIYVRTLYIQNAKQSESPFFYAENREAISSILRGVRTIARNLLAGQIHTEENERERDNLGELKAAVSLNTPNELLLREMVEIVDRIISDKRGTMTTDVEPETEFFVADEIRRLRKLMECLDGRRYFRVTVYAKGEHVRSVVLSV